MVSQLYPALYLSCLFSFYVDEQGQPLFPHCLGEALSSLDHLLLSGSSCGFSADLLSNYLFPCLTYTFSFFLHICKTFNLSLSNCILFLSEHHQQFVGILWNSAPTFQQIPAPHIQELSANCQDSLQFVIQVCIDNTKLPWG